MSYKISKNLEGLIYSLIQEQINEETAVIVRETITILNANEKISEKFLIKIRLKVVSLEFVLFLLPFILLRGFYKYNLISGE